MVSLQRSLGTAGDAYPRLMTIHTEHPFMPDPEDRNQARRFRGRLVAPVTIVTAGGEDGRVGLTVSSLVVIEGDPPIVQLVVGPNSDLWDVVEESGRFVIHVCRREDNNTAEVFAGMRPSPGGVFAGSATEQSEWGPVLAGIANRAFCTFRRKEEIGYSGLVTGVIDEVDVTDLEGPLAYFRGRYRSLG